MLEFPREFFNSEYREDFLVDSTMKTVWAAEMELLSDIDAVCQKYNLQWFAYWGTLLGAVRHKGYVPWDDDVDIAMKRDDYNKLMQVLPKELPETYRVFSPLTELGYDNYWSCVTNADTISIEPERLRKFHNCPFWVGIDIIPLDYVPRNPKDVATENAFLELSMQAMYIAKREVKVKKDMKDLKQAVRCLEENLHIKIDKKKPLAKELARVSNLIASSYMDLESDYLTLQTTNIRNGGKFLYPREWWESAVALPFETLMIPAPVGYDGVLRMIYGDYSVRVRGGTEHDYPFYNKQLQQLRDKMQEMEKSAGEVQK